MVERIRLGEDNAARKLRRSLRETGFALLRNPPIATDLVQRLEAKWLVFFSTAGKTEYAAPKRSESQAGYLSLARAEKAIGADVADLKECYQHSPGGRLPPGLVGDVLAYRAKAIQTGRMLAHWIAGSNSRQTRALQADRDWVDDHATLLRIVHYPPTPDETDGAVRAAAHRDINLLTLLPISQQPGLEVRQRDGQWTALHAEPGTCVVNAGDMLAELTGNDFPSTEHRVVNPPSSANVSRIAMPVFLTPNFAQPLSARHTAGSYLEERLQAIYGHSE